jgi:hypothetical protein
LQLPGKITVDKLFFIGDIMDRLLKSKTFWTGVSALLTAGAGYATGEMNGPQAIQLGVTGALGVFLRMAVTKQF